MAEIELWRVVLERLQQGQACALLAVVDSEGSSPGRAGALMVVGSGGPLFGTIGGGRVEHDLVDAAVAALNHNSLKPALLPRVHWPGVANSSGMVCGGRQTLALAPLDTRHLSQVCQLVNELDAGESVGWSLSGEGWQRLSPVPSEQGLSIESDCWRYCHRSTDGWPVYLIGGGHVSLALSRLLDRLDFRVIVVEERSHIGTLEANTHAYRRLQCDYALLGDLVGPGPEVLVAIMTHDYQRDRVALLALRHTRLAYLGLLGSHGKVRRLLDEEGLSELAQAAHFHAPMGLAIGSHTPEEIAVSIAAQMIAVRNEGNLGMETGGAANAVSRTFGRHER